MIRINLYQPHPSQKTIRQDNHRYKVLVCGRRFGKTTLSINELVYSGFKKAGDYWYIAPTYRQAKEIGWRMLKEIWYKLPEELKKDKNESELWVEINTKDGISRISLKGADNEDSLRGSGISGMVIDEVDSMRAFDYLWQNALSPSLRDKKGWTWFVGTPKGYYNLYRLSELEKIDEEYKFFHFTSYDNPYLEAGEINKEKIRLTEDAFGQEYLADFKKYTGLIYKEFNRNIHLVDEIELNGFGSYYRTMDFGAVNPTVCLYIKVDKDDNFWVYDEYYQTERTTDYHAGQILAKYPQTYFVATFGDPSGKQDIIDYARWNLHITPANKQVMDSLTGTLKPSADQDWVNYGIGLIQQRLKIDVITKKPRLTISKRCVSLIREFESYRWEERKDKTLNEKEIPVKADDHCLDALRYFMVSYKKLQIRKKIRLEQPVSRITGY